MSALALGAGYVLDLMLGDPPRWPHPVVWFGRVIAAGERRLNHGSARARLCKGGVFTVGAIAGVWFAARLAFLLAASVSTWFALGLEIVGIFFCLANRTLVDEGRAVFRALDRGLAEGRRQLSRIVGRDTAALDDRQVRVAVFETMAENLGDGVVAPLFWHAVGGLPAMLAYKMVNTLDSMIGHRDERHEWFGKFAARIDDAANWIPARLTALLMVAVAASGRGARFALRYGRAHASPNAGWPEAALAGILDLRFGGPNRYDGELVDKPWIGENPRAIESGEIAAVTRINHAVCLLAVVLAGLAAWWRGAPW